MRKFSQIFMMAAVFAVMFVACENEVEETGVELKKGLSQISERGVEGESLPGNFVSTDDDQVCYDMVSQGLIGELDTELRGFKIDPPVDYSDGNVNVTLTNKGVVLNWTALKGTKVHAFIVKGGPNFNVYDYTGTNFEWDNGLISPLNKGKFPAISHYNVCYTPPQADEQGCTPGYWRNHADRWVGVAPGDDFDAIFGVDLFDPNITLGVAIWAQGGGYNALARHATAALLNAYAKVEGSNGQFVNFPYSVDEVKQMVQDAVADDTIEATKDLLAAANELGCPLSGTRAVAVQ